MQRGKTARKGSMRSKGGMKTSRSMGAPMAGKKVGGGKKIVGKKIVGKKIVDKPSVRTTTGSRPGRIGEKSRRPRKLDI